VMGTKGDVLLVMVAASLAARAVACSRSIKISANIVVPPLVRGGHWAQCSRADVMAITKCRSVQNASPPLRSAIDLANPTPTGPQFDIGGKVGQWAELSFALGMRI
jgi:hypothetical protein